MPQSALTSTWRATGVWRASWPPPRVRLITTGEPVGSEEWRKWLVRYIERRERALWNAFDLYGSSGLAEVQEAYDTPAHRAMLDQLAAEADRLPFDWGSVPFRKAKLAALLRDPARYVPCKALNRKGR
jgi:hypothetical protein